MSGQLAAFSGGMPPLYDLPFAQELENEAFIDPSVYLHVLRIASHLACTGKEGNHFGRIYVIGSLDQIKERIRHLANDVAPLAAKEGNHFFIVKEDGSPDKDGEDFIKEHLPFDGAFVIDGQNRGRIYATKVVLQTASSSTGGKASEQGVQGGTGHASSLKFSGDVQNCVVIKASEDSLGEVFVCFRGNKQRWMLPNPRAPKELLYAGDVPQRNIHFQGRKKELEKIEQMLFKEEKQGCSTTALIVGLGGMGKTQTAKEFLHQMSERGACGDGHDVLMWVDAGGEIENQFRRVAEQLIDLGGEGGGEDAETSLSMEEVLQGIGKFLSKQKRWLLVFDNAEDWNVIGRFIPNVRGRAIGHVLVTTRERMGGCSDVVEMRGMQAEEARQLLQKLLPLEKATFSEQTNGSHYTDKDGRRSPFEELLELLEGYPLAIVQACAYLCHNRSCSIEAYIEKYKKSCKRWKQREQDVFEKGMGPADKYRLSVSATLQLTLERMQREEPNGPLAVDLLRSAACLDAGGFSRRLFERAAAVLVSKRRDNEDKQRGGKIARELLTASFVFSSFFRNSLISGQTDPENRTPKSPSQSSSLESLVHEADQAIDLLDRYSLVTDSGRMKTDRFQEGEGSGGIGSAKELSMHRVVRELAMLEKGQPECATSCSAALAAIEEEGKLLIKEWESLSSFRGLEPKQKESAPHLSAVLSHYLAAAEVQQKISTAHKGKHADKDPGGVRETDSAIDRPSENFFITLLLGQDIEEMADSSQMDRGLCVVSSVGHVQTVESLMKKGARVNPDNCKDGSPLHWASEAGQTDVVKFLLEKGANFMAVDKNGSIALHWAARGRQRDVARILVAQSPHLCDMKNKRGEMPLHVASLYGHKEVVELLLSHNASVDVADSRGETPICHAAGASLEIVQLLFAKGATIPSGSKWVSAFETAFKSRKFAILQFFFQNGADVNINHSPRHLNPEGMSALHVALEEKDNEMVEFLLSHNASPNQPVSCATWVDRGWSEFPLYKAVQWGNTSVVELLLQKGAKDCLNMEVLHPQVFKCGTALFEASQRGDQEIVALLLSYGVDTIDESATDDGETPLYAAAGASLEVVQLLLNHGATMPPNESREQKSPFFNAVRHGKVEIVRFFLERAGIVDTNLKNRHHPDYGKTFLHVASERGHKEVVEILLRYNATADALSHPLGGDGQTALYYASGATVEVVQLLLKEGATLPSNGSEQKSPLNRAVENHQFEIVKSLLENGVDVNLQTKGDQGKTALHVASACGDSEMVDFLISRKASLKLVDDRGETALHVAVHEMQQPFRIAPRSRYLSTVKLLLQSGADVNMKASARRRGMTVLHQASADSNREIVELLLNYNAAIDAVDDLGLTPLCYAVRRNLEVVRLLLARGATIPSTGSDWPSPLNQAVESPVKRGKIEIVKLLLENGADVNLQTKWDRGRTGLHVASQRGDKEMVKFLLQEGADPTLEDDEGMTAMQKDPTR